MHARIQPALSTHHIRDTHHAKTCDMVACVPPNLFAVSFRLDYIEKRLEFCESPASANRQLGNKAPTPLRRVCALSLFRDHRDINKKYVKHEKKMLLTTYIL